MGLAHRDRELGFPASVQFAETGVAIAVRIALDVLIPEDRQRDVLALQLPMSARPVGLDLPPVTLLRPGIGEQPGFERGIGQLRPAAWKRLIVARTVDAAIPIRRAISRVGTPPTNFNRRTSRTWRMVVLSAGIRSLLWTAKGADLSRPAEAPDPGRGHPGMVGDIISERWARSSRNGWAASSRNEGRLPPESANRHRGSRFTKS